MIQRRFVVLAVSLVLVAAASQPSVAAESVKHSGTILEMDAGRGRLVLEEVGPWQVRDGVTQVIRRTIVLTAATRFAIALRANAPDGFAGAFVEGTLDPAALEVGDLITAECRHDGRRIVALKITFADARE